MKNPVRIGIIDSGVHLTHPHIGGIAGGVTIEADALQPDFSDRMGHGTAVAALIHALAPHAELFAIRVFDHSLATSVHRVERAIDWCLENKINIINLSLGTTNQDHRVIFSAAVQRVQFAKAVLISAFEMNGKPMLPGSMPGVIGVRADKALPREKYSYEEYEGRRVFSASPYPLDIPGVPREHNLNGVSFAVAHITAHLARLCSMQEHEGNWEEFLMRGIALLLPA